MYIDLYVITQSKLLVIIYQWRSEGGAGGAAAPGRRPEGGAKILPKI